MMVITGEDICCGQLSLFLVLVSLDEFFWMEELSLHSPKVCPAYQWSIFSFFIILYPILMPLHLQPFRLGIIF